MLTDPAAAKRDGCTAPNSLALVGTTFVLAQKKFPSVWALKKICYPALALIMKEF